MWLPVAAPLPVSVARADALDVGVAWLDVGIRVAMLS